MEIRIEKWSMREEPDDPYMAPEMRSKMLVGNVYGYPGRPEGERVKTSPISEVDGRLVVTSSGHRYRLGEVDPLYAMWLDANDYAFDPEQPIAFGKPPLRKRDRDRSPR